MEVVDGVRFSERVGYILEHVSVSWQPWNNPTKNSNHQIFPIETFKLELLLLSFFTANIYFLKDEIFEKVGCNVRFTNLMQVVDGVRCSEKIGYILGYVLVSWQP